ncbi:hypothetical protein [uncultured Paenalcaligenes sp.]|nr:hypothetical protein [uncultured Paenalcaligenes sp.]
MSQGRSIRLFLVDGSPKGLMTAEIVNNPALKGEACRIQSELA